MAHKVIAYPDRIDNVTIAVVVAVVSGVAQECYSASAETAG